MAWIAENLRGTRTFDDFVLGHLTTGTSKKEWVIDRPMKITAIRINSAVGSVGAGANTIDIMQNGTTIYSTNAKPTIGSTVTGDWTVLAPDNGLGILAAGDVLRWDCTGVSATNGPDRTSISIAAKHV